MVLRHRGIVNRNVDFNSETFFAISMGKYMIIMVLSHGEIRLTLLMQWCLLCTIAT